MGILLNKHKQFIHTRVSCIPQSYVNLSLSRFCFRMYVNVGLCDENLNSTGIFVVTPV
jgi:hypothetical protein